MAKQTTTPDDVLKFWFGLPPEAHFGKDVELDAKISSQFSDTLEAAKQGQCDDWCDTPEGSLALVILLDQFSRNIHRGSAEMFAADDKALALADKLLRSGDYRQLQPDQVRWLVIPFMHSEKLSDQERCVDLCQEHGLDDTVSYAADHADIIRKFGRFPHRNSLLDRETRVEEKEFLDGGGFAG